jgi:hypothetical protein
MTKKIIITEQQLKMITLLIKESSQSVIVKQLHDVLKNSYEPSSVIYREGGEYFNKAIILNKVDEKMVSPSDMQEYLRLKFNLADNDNVNEALQVVISDWYNGKIDHTYGLSKNVSFR